MLFFKYTIKQCLVSIISQIQKSEQLGAQTIQAKSWKKCKSHSCCRNVYRTLDGHIFWDTRYPKVKCANMKMHIWQTSRATEIMRCHC